MRQIMGGTGPIVAGAATGAFDSRLTEVEVRLARIEAKLDELTDQLARSREATNRESRTTIDGGGRVVLAAGRAHVAPAGVVDPPA